MRIQTARSMPGARLHALLIAPLLLASTDPGVEPRRVDLELRGDSAWVTVDGTRTRLACTDPLGTGTIHASDEAAGGTVFFAADHGLFNWSSEVAHVDPIALGDGAPTETPVGVVVEGEDRIWVATHSGLYCLDSRFFFGREIRDVDRLPPPPYLGLERGEGGALAIRTEQGVASFVPGEDPKPVVTVTFVNGVAFEPGHRYDIDANGVVALQVGGEAAGGASFRYRLEHHHLWRPLDADAAVSAALEPGSHTLLVTAWDHELRRSDELPVLVRVAYPEAFDKRTLLPLAAGATVVVLAAFLALARRRGGGLGRYWKATLSTIFVLTVGLQLLVAVIPHGRSWPFVGFTMYLERYVEGSVTYKMTLTLDLPEGGTRTVEPYDAGYGLFEFRRTLAEVVHGSPAERDAFLTMLNHRHWRTGAVGFRIADERRRLTANGPVMVAPTLFCSHPKKSHAETR